MKRADPSKIDRGICGIFDSHCHYDHPAFDDDRDELLERLMSHGSAVEYLMHAACDLGSSHAGIELAKRYPNYYTSVGIHPTYIHYKEKLPPDYIDRLRELAAYPKVKAIGEIGLDYHREDSDREEQKRVFIEQLELAKELGLPVIIHCRDAYGDMLEIIKKHRPKGVCHCFSGSAETAAEFVKLGLYIAFGGMLTRKNAEKPKRAFMAVPKDRLLFETDAPFLAPDEFTHKRCESGMIACVAETAEQLCGIPAQELADITNKNARTLFGI